MFIFSMKNKMLKVMQMVAVESGFKSVTFVFEFQLCIQYLHDLRAFCFLLSKMECV